MNLMLLGLSMLVFGMTLDTTPQVRVTGTAVSEVAPDVMVWQISVRTERSGIAEAASAHQKEVASTLAYLNTQGIAEKKTQMTRMILEEVWDYQARERVRTGFQALTSIRFMSDDLSGYASMWEGLSRLGMVTIQGVQFDTSERIPLQNSTRSEALLAAKAKAEAMAKTLGGAIGRPLVIVENSGTDDIIRQGAGPVNAMMRQAVPEMNSGSSLAPGLVSVRVTVEVTFALLEAAAQDQSRGS
jgi:hypothetical protein